MTTNTVAIQKHFIDLLKSVALESRSGTLQVRTPTGAWRFYCLLGDIRAASVTPTTLLDSVKLDPDSSLLKILMALAREKETHCSFSQSEESPPPHALLVHVPIQTALGQIARHAADPVLIRERLVSPNKRFVATETTVFLADSQLLNSDECFLLSRLDSPLTIEDILAISPFKEDETLRHLFVLYLLGMIDAQDSAEKSKGQTIPAATIPSSKLKAVNQDETSSKAAADVFTSERKEQSESPDWLKLKCEIEEKTYLISHGNFYDLLNVSRKSDEDEIKAAYYRLAKRFHPDHYQASAPKPVHEQLAVLFAHLTEAYQTLSDSAKRAEYDRNLAVQSSKTTAQRAADTTFASEKERAKKSFSEGKALFEQEQYLKSLPYLREATHLNPTHAKYRALLASAFSKLPQHRKEAEEQFLRAIELEPQNAFFYATLGSFYLEVNLASRARKYFEQALKIDPANEVALRALGRRPARIKKQKSFGKKIKNLFSKS